MIEMYTYMYDGRIKERFSNRLVIYLFGNEGIQYVNITE